MNEIDSVVAEFLAESFENLDALDRDLVALEKEPQDRERLASVFRTIHTIKGTCGFFGFKRLGALTHAGENLLSRLRDGALLLSPEIATGLLSMVDAVRGILAHIEKTGTESEADHAALIDVLTRLQEGREPLKVPENTEVVEAASSVAVEGNIRVDVGLLDKLMDLVGELVLARNQILQSTAVQNEPAFQQVTQRLNLITSELQEGVMKTRLQTIGSLWNRFPRVVRDLALACGRNVRIVMEGRETELDKTILEAIKDPLTHLVRNAVDHGLESEAERRRAGKPDHGQLTLRAYHEGGQVIIEVSDDGRGMDVERIRRKALERGLVTAEQSARLSDREAMRLVFVPGFSTADRVTDISGRGVGMDVVKTNIEKIGGTVDLQSRPGRGSTVRIKIPLTLAIIPALIVVADGDRYAIPQVNLLELVRLDAEQARTRIEMLYGVPVYRLRGDLLPLVHLDRMLDVERAAEDESINIVVLQTDDRPFGLVVHSIIDTEEIVVKPLGNHLKGIPLYSGATILGDGRPALILDVLGIAQTSGLVAEVRDRSIPTPETPSQGETKPLHTLLLVEVGEDRRMALPIERVDRLEEVAPSSVERASGEEVVQYRGRILPLIHPGRLLPDATPIGEPCDTLQVVVCSDGGRSVGLVVHRILDIVETTLDLERGARIEGILGTAVVKDRITDLLDVPGLMRGSSSGRA